MNTTPVLYIFSGLPGVGKTTLSKKLSTYLKAAYLRIDTIEQTLKDTCNIKVEGEGYDLAYKIAEDNLLLGNSVVSDSCNPINLTRNAWKEIAKNTNSNFKDIEVICSNLDAHKKRAEERLSNIKNLILPTWEQIKNRGYDIWETDRIIIDTYNKSIDDTFEQLKNLLGV